MADAQLAYTFVIRKKTGTELWYFRHQTLAKPARIPGKPGEPVFHREYCKLLSAATKEQMAAEQRADDTSLRWLVEQYEESKFWLQLKPKTRLSYKRELERLKDMAGDLPFRKLTATGVRKMRDSVIDAVCESQRQAIAVRKAADEAAEANHQRRVEKAIAKGKPTPEKRKSRRRPPSPVDDQTGVRTADAFKSVLGVLMSYAARCELIEKSPVKGVEKMQRKSNIDSHDPWHEHQIATVIARAPRTIRDGVVLGVCTGQRLEDVVAITKQRVLGDDIQVRQLKTNVLVEVPITGPLKDLVARRMGSNGPDDSNLLLTREDGSAYTERLFAEHLREFLDSLGWFDISFHGLRYAAAARLNEAGCSVAVISSIVGHSTYEMAMKYATKRQNAALAGRAMEALAMRSDRE